MTMTRDERIERFRKSLGPVSLPTQADCQAVLDRLGELEADKRRLEWLAANYCDVLWSSDDAGGEYVDLDAPDLATSMEWSLAPDRLQRFRLAIDEAIVALTGSSRG